MLVFSYLSDFSVLMEKRKMKLGYSFSLIEMTGRSCDS